MGLCQGAKEDIKSSKFSQSTGSTDIKMEAEEIASDIDAWIETCGFSKDPIIDDGKKKNYRFTVHARKEEAKNLNY